MTPTNKSDVTPASGSAREKERLDDRAVKETLKADDKPGEKSILPGPPVPPKTQARLKASRETDRTRVPADHSRRLRNEKEQHK